MFGRRSYADSRMRPCLFEGLAEGRALGAQASAWRCPVGTGRHSVGVDPQRRGWPHGAGDGRTVPEMVEKTCFVHPASRRHPDRVPDATRTLFEDALMPF
jgi:hypothetical protein